MIADYGMLAVDGMVVVVVVLDEERTTVAGSHVWVVLDHAYPQSVVYQTTNVVVGDEFAEVQRRVVEMVSVGYSPWELGMTQLY
jgi:hypothetical protein